LNSKAFLAAWKLAPKVPEPILRGLANLAADVAWLKRGKGVQRLENNYRRVRPELSDKHIRALSRQGMRSYLRYFREAFTLPAVTGQQLAARTRVVGAEHVRNALRDFGSPVIALSHSGNWDLAGAWAAAHLVPVLTVAEKLEPAEVYQAFVNFRNSLGIEVLGLGDNGVFDSLVAGAKRGGLIIPLLADRDLTYRGVEVELLGHKARVAAGPAAVSLEAGVPLLLATIHYEKLNGKRRKAAGTPWGIVITFIQVRNPEVNSFAIRDSATPVSTSAQNDDLSGVILRPTGSAESQKVNELTQAWVDQLGEFLKEHTEDWHMLQSVFVEDLDPTKYEATLQKARLNTSQRPLPQNDEEE